MNSQVGPSDSTTSPPTWREVLAGEREQEYFIQLMRFIESERGAGKTIYPANSDIFNALTLTPFESVRVVIIGQDPYHGPNQAHGLSFSVLPGVPPPPSLVNIFKELKSDLGIERPQHGCLLSWAKQGVLLLNAVLSVEGGKPGSHANRGWERFTDRVIQVINDRHEHVVFLLWGAYAQKKGARIDPNRHLALTSPHPSPFSADKGFFGCRHFSRANEYLRAHGRGVIDWDIAAP